eukprot:m.116253 g.116253  ORF g.116253 m.116253 type:complete len:90 (+) comp28489_c0_seq1:1226-1495(+)
MRLNTIVVVSMEANLSTVKAMCWGGNNKNFTKNNFKSLLIIATASFVGTQAHIWNDGERSNARTHILWSVTVRTLATALNHDFYFSLYP